MMDWHVSAWYSVGCLWVIGTLCIMGLLYKHYRENWLQFFGLAGMALWSFGRGSVLFERAMDGGTVGDFQLIGHISMLLYVLGTTLKVIKYRDETPSKPTSGLQQSV
jgi:hypothetical protein